MIGLDFVKTVDKDWKKHIKLSDGRPYCEDYCPLSGASCRKEDCSFWTKSLKECGYLQNNRYSKNTILDIRNLIDEEFP